MRFTSYINWLNENEKGDITILFPGSFKPLHMGHVSLILRYLNHPNVKEVRVLIGPGIRNGITENEAFEIATLLLKGLNNVIIETVTYPSPILTAYKYIETAKPGIYTMAGVEKDKGPRGYQRVLDFVKSYNEGGKYYHLKPKGVSVIELPIDIKPVLYKGRTDEYEGKPISASILRQDILNDDYNNFRTNYLGCDEETIKKIWKTTQMVITESSSNVDFDVSDDNLLPDRVIDAFCNRIKRIINDHGNKDNLQIKQELNRIKYLNGRKIPKKINDLLKESKLFEGGNAIPESRDLTKEELLKTFEYVEKVTTKLLNISKEDLFPVGSFAKKPETETYGDIDVLLNIKSLGIDENEVLDYVYDKFNSSGYTAVKSKGFNQVSVGFPIEGYKNKGIAQVDFMLASSMQWSKFAYHVSPSSKYKAAYAHFLMSAIITESFKKTEKLDKNGEVEEYSFVSFRLPSGLFKVTKTHKGKLGRVKTAKITKEEFISNDPKDAIYYTFGKDYPIDDMRSFEKIWELMHRRDFIHKDKLPVILDKFRHYLTNNSMSFPKEAINKYPEIFKINESLNEKFTEDSDPIKDMGIGMEEKINKFINSKLADAAAADDIWYKLFICIEWRQVEYVKYLLEKYRYAKDKIEGFIIHNQMKKHPNQKIDKMLNNYYESLNEKFKETLDPIEDMGIGLYYIKTVSSTKLLLDNPGFHEYLKQNNIKCEIINKHTTVCTIKLIGDRTSLIKMIRTFWPGSSEAVIDDRIKKINEKFTDESDPIRDMGIGQDYLWSHLKPGDIIECKKSFYINYNHRFSNEKEHITKFTETTHKPINAGEKLKIREIKDFWLRKKDLLCISYSYVDSQENKNQFYKNHFLHDLWMLEQLEKFKKHFIVIPKSNESLNEKFTEEGDPIKDLGIGDVYILKKSIKDFIKLVKNYVDEYGNSWDSTLTKVNLYSWGLYVDIGYWPGGTKNILVKFMKQSGLYNYLKYPGETGSSYEGRDFSWNVKKEYEDLFVRFQKVYKNEFIKENINEADISIRKLNTHMQHIEELLFEGNEGLKFINYIISNLFNKLTNKPSEVIVSTKIDGSPTMMLWSKFPGLKDYGVGTKTVFNKQPITSHTDEDVDKNFGDRPDLAEKLKTLLKYAKQIQIPEGEIWQGDFLFSKDILKKEGNIISFKPNTIRYSVDIDSDLGQKIMNSEFGIIWHTRYIGEDISSVRTVYSINLENISHPDGIYMSEPYLNQIDVDKLKDFIKDNKNLKNKISKVSQKLNDLNSEKYNEFLEYKTFQVLFLKFYNKIIRTKDTLDSKTFAKDFIEFIKSEKSENIVLKIKEFISKYSDIINLIIDLMKDITQIKRDLLVRLNKLQTYSASVELKSGGYKNVNQEGFAISSPSGDVVKLVDREEFSYANFSPEIVKGWVKK